MKLKTFFCENLKKKMKWKTFFVKIWWKKEIVMVYLSQIMPSCVNLNLSSPKMWAKFTHIHFSSPKIWAKNEPRSWVNWKKDHSRSHLPSSENYYINIFFHRKDFFSPNFFIYYITFLSLLSIFISKKGFVCAKTNPYGKSWSRAPNEAYPGKRSLENEM